MRPRVVHDAGLVLLKFGDDILSVFLQGDDAFCAGAWFFKIGGKEYGFIFSKVEQGDAGTRAWN